MIEVLKEFDDSIMSINADTHNLTNKKRYMILSKNHTTSGCLHRKARWT